ncbi:MAG TPA: tungstate ABC transporter substrate-binding protein WtpA [Stellaceae bacterium]|nr:tungstate ABC transporter substrate-binding protein WtpA [Stellaceae bacterium]
MQRRRGLPAALSFALGVLATAGAAQAAGPVILTVFGAGTLAVPFRELDVAFQKRHPNVTVRAQFGGSVMMARRIIDLHQPADVLAVADYSVIPKYLFKTKAADWYAGFARNAITFMYTDKSRFADQVTPQNWYTYLARKRVEIGRSNPDTDPSGYQTVQMLELAQRHYHAPGLAAKILANASRANMRDTETALISALQLGQIDYLAIYRSDALQHHMRYLKLPAEINLEDPARSSEYATAVVHTKNGDLRGKPIIYALTIPKSAGHAREAADYVAFVLGPEGQAIMAKSGFGTVKPAYAVNAEAMPASLRGLVEPWPGS